MAYPPLSTGLFYVAFALLLTFLDVCMWSPLFLGSLSLLADFLLPCTVLTLNASIHSFIGQLFSAALVQHLPLASVIQMPACGLPSSKFQLLIGLSVCSPSPSLNWGLLIVTSVGWWFLEPGGTDTRWLSAHVYTHLPIDSQTFWRTSLDVLIVILKKLWKCQRTSQRIASSFLVLSCKPLIL